MLTEVFLKNQQTKNPTPGRCYETKHTKKQARDKKREEFFKSKDWKMRVILYVIYCIHRSTEHVCPSQTTLGACINVNRDTCRNTYLKPLVKDGWLGKWIFRFYQTCIYKLPKGNRQQIAYLFRGVKRPVGFKLPPWLFGMIMGTMTASQAYALLKYDLTHESFLRKGIRSKKYYQNKEKFKKKLLKCKFGSPDPNMVEILKTKYSLNQQKAEFLARNSVRVMSLAMEDVDSYVQKFEKKVSNYFGFLLNRCKHHGSREHSQMRNAQRVVEKKIDELLATVSEKYPHLKTLDDILNLKLDPLIDSQQDYNFLGGALENARALSQAQESPQTLAQSEPKTPQERLAWTKGFLTSSKKKLEFVSKESEVDRATTTSKPFVLFLQNLEAVEKSILRVYQKIQGVWVDREFTFARPDFKRAVLDYFEQSFKDARVSY